MTRSSSEIGEVRTGLDGQYYMVFASSCEAEAYCERVGVRTALHCFGQFENAILLSDLEHIQHDAHVATAEDAGFEVMFDSCHRPVLVDLITLLGVA